MMGGQAVKDAHPRDTRGALGAFALVVWLLGPLVVPATLAAAAAFDSGVTAVVASVAAATWSVLSCWGWGYLTLRGASRRREQQRTSWRWPHRSSPGPSRWRPAPAADPEGS